MDAAEKKKYRVKPILLTLEDIDLIRGLITGTLDNENKVGQQQRRIRLYRINRRLYRARLELEKK
jgi:hypothetical protein